MTAVPVLVLTEPLSWWGGVDEDGIVTDVHHPQHGESVTGKVVLMRSGRGSSSASSVLAEQIRSGAAPAALVMTSPDVILGLGAIVARELYGTSLPIVVVTEPEYRELASLKEYDPEGLRLKVHKHDSTEA